MGKGTSVALRINEDATNIESGRRAWIFYRTSKPAAEESIDKKLKAIQENYERKGFSIVGATIAQGDDIGMIDAVSADTIDGVDETRMQQLLMEKNSLMEQLNQIAKTKEQDKKAAERINTIFPVLEGLKNHPITYDDEIVRQLIDCVVVESKEQIKIIFRGGLQVEQKLQKENACMIKVLPNLKFYSGL